MAVKVGDTIGRYTVLSHLASGGMGELWLARRTHARAGDTTVVIKQLHPVMAFDRAFVEMFIDEARIASQLDHPNVVRVHALEELEDTCFIVMEHLHGQPVSALLTEATRRRTRLPLAAAAGIVTDICAGLHHVHTRASAEGQPLKIVHRDVTPDNLVLTYDGAVKLIDFGIARAMERLHRTRAGQVKGKRPYMSPEQFMGLPVGPAADLYSLAVVFHELLTGQQLFPPSSLGPMQELELRQQPPPPSRLVPGLPAGLDALVLRALRYDAVERFPDCASFADELTACLTATGMTVNPAQRAELIASWLPAAEGDEEVTTDPGLDRWLERTVSRSPLGLEAEDARLEAPAQVVAPVVSAPSAATLALPAAELDAATAQPPPPGPSGASAATGPAGATAATGPAGATAATGHTGQTGLPSPSQIARVAGASPNTGTTRLPPAADAEPPPARGLFAGAPQLLVAVTALGLVAGLVVLLYRPAQSPLPPDSVEPEPAATTELPVPRVLPEPAPAPRLARLSLTTSSPVLVSEKGSALGHTPLRALPLSPGRHHLRLVDLSIGIDQMMEVDLVADREIKRRIAFPAGTLKVSSVTPTRLLVDGALQKAQAVELSLQPGPHSVELRDEGKGASLRESFVLQSAEVLTLTCNLESHHCERASVHVSQPVAP